MASGKAGLLASADDEGRSAPDPDPDPDPDPAFDPHPFWPGL